MVPGGRNVIFHVQPSILWGAYLLAFGALVRSRRRGSTMNRDGPTPNRVRKLCGSAWLPLALRSLDTFSLWNDLVQKYSRCDLTYPSDKLLAMAGVAKLFQGAINEKYLAGLWSSHVLTMMDWRVYDPRPRQSTQYRALLSRDLVVLQRPDLKVGPGLSKSGRGNISL